MNPAIAESVAFALLLAALGFAVLRPRGMNEAAVAVPAAILVVAVGIVPPSAAWAVLVRFGPTVLFLAGILLFGYLAADAGVFRYLGARAAQASRGRPIRLLTVVVGLAAAVTAVLTLDATIVLLTPVILTAATGLGVAPRPHLYATVRLANSASILLPISNLTNLIAFSYAGLTFGRFTALMALPWLFVCAAEWVALRLYFRRNLAVGAPLSPKREIPRYDAVLAEALPRYALIVSGLTVAGFVATSMAGVSPAWAAFCGAAAMVARQARLHTVRPRELLRAASLGFCAFVLALAVIVDGVLRHGLGGALRNVIPADSGILAILGIAFLAAAMANVVNNLPATLALVPLLVDRPALMLAMLLGVNIGPNLSYAGSLATLLWRRLLPERHRPHAKQFHLLSLVTVPPILAGSSVLLWVALQL
ncbi:MAG: SLC13 family permease [Nakamurella sp.]